MTNFLGTLALEMGFLALLGILYYFYQRRKILNYESQKEPMIMGYILQSCLTERGETPHTELDTLIESLDDYLHNRVTTPPFALLKRFAESAECSPELKDVIFEGLTELGHGKK